MKSSETIRTTDIVSLGKVTFGFDSSHRKISRTVVAATATVPSTITEILNNDDAPTTIGALRLAYAYPSGRLATTAIGLISDSRSYDLYGLLKTYTAKYTPTGGIAQVLYSYTLTRDVMSRIYDITETIGGVTTKFVYTYDVSGRLKTVTKNAALITSINYDPNGNKLNGTIDGIPFVATYDAQDRLLTFRAKTYQHNANGELITIKSGTTTLSSFAYDVFGDLLQATTSAGVTKYTIDGLRRRAAVALGALAPTTYLYESNLRIAATVSAGAIAQEYVYATNINVPDYIVKAGIKYHVIKDHRGSVRLVVNSATGAIAQRMNYGSFGQVISDSAPGFQPFGFAGGLYDRQTKLVHFGARDYDPETGRWTSKDPVLFAGGDSNLFGYTFNDPINLIDPNGESPIIVAAVIGAFIGTFLTPTPTDTQMGPLGEAGRVAAGAAAGAAVGGMCAVAATGAEIAIGGMRFAPFGNRTSNPTGQLPHYHRRTTDPGTGQTAPGQGIGRHRPWDTRSTDKSFWDRF